VRIKLRIKSDCVADTWKFHQLKMEQDVEMSGATRKPVRKSRCMPNAKLGYPILFVILFVSLCFFGLTSSTSAYGIVKLRVITTGGEFRFGWQKATISGVETSFSDIYSKVPIDKTKNYSQQTGSVWGAVQIAGTFLIVIASLLFKSHKNQGIVPTLEAYLGITLW
jgi:hypothetical protein